MSLRALSRRKRRRRRSKTSKAAPAPLLARRLVSRVSPIFDAEADRRDELADLSWLELLFRYGPPINDD